MSRLGLAFEQCEVLLLARRAARLVARHVGCDDEQPPSRILGPMHKRSRECLLREILGALGIPYLAVEKSHERAVGIAVHLRDVFWHSSLNPGMRARVAPIRPAASAFSLPIQS